MRAWIFYQFGGSEKTRSDNMTRLYSQVPQCSYKLMQSMFWHCWSLVSSDFQNNLLSASRFICILWATYITGSYSKTLCELHVTDVSSREIRDVLFMINTLLYYHTTVAYPGILFGGVQQIQLRTEDRENRDLGTVAP